MRSTTACLLVLALSCIGCTTMMNIRGIGEFHSPEQGEVKVAGIKIGTERGVDKEVISVDRVTNLPVQSSLELHAQDEMLIPESLIIVVIISSIVRDIVRDIINSITILPI